MATDRQGRRSAVAVAAVEAADQLFLGVVLDVEREAFLRELDLVQDVHEKNAQRQRDQRGVERDAEAVRDGGRVAFDGELCALRSTARIRAISSADRNGLTT